MKKPILTRLRDWWRGTPPEDYPILGFSLKSDLPPPPPSMIRGDGGRKALPGLRLYLPDGTEVTQAYLAQEKEIERLKSKIAYLKRQNRMVWGMAMNLKATWPAIYNTFFTSPRPTKKGKKA